MPPRVRSLLAPLVLSALATASPALAQSTAPRPEPQPTGTAHITGRVLAKDNGAPVRRARVRIEGTPAETTNAGPKRAYVQQEVETNEHGAFDFAGLPGGSYHISVPDTNGFVALARPREAIVSEGGALEVPIRLERTGAIVGRIADSKAEGVLGVEVRALRRSDFRGHVTLMPYYSYGNGSRASTNDLGEFRLFNLAPGEYFIVATPLSPQRDQAAARRSGFVTTYYPGTQALSGARALVLRSGRDITHVNFVLASGPLARVVINAVDSRGLTLGRDASTTLNLRSDVYFALPTSMRQASHQDNGPFVFTEVPLGDYYVIVSTSGLQEAAYVDVNVDGDVTLSVQTNTGAKVSGRFVFQGPAPDARSDRPPPNAEVSAIRPPFKYGPSYAKDGVFRIEGVDQFELTGLRGPMVLHASMNGALLVSINRAGGEDLAGKPIHFTGTEIIDDLLVVFTYEKAQVEVTLTGLREPDDAEKVLAVLFPEDPTRWHAGSMTYTVIESSREMPVQSVATGRVSRRSARTFTFSLGPVVPGRYLIAAVPSPEVIFPTEPAVLERLRPLAVPVTLVAGEAAKAEVSVSRPQQGGKGQ